MDDTGTKSRILVVGTVSNVFPRFQADFSTVRKSFSKDFEVFTYLVESDSTDKTLVALHELSDTNDNFHFKSFGDLRDSIPDRVERIRYCRNQYVEYIRANFQKYKWEYIVVADLDGMNRALNYEAVRSCFTRLDWDCCLSNQTGGYYDIFALREPNWQPINYFEEVEVGRAKIGNLRLSKFDFLNRIRLILLEDSIKKNAIYSKMKRIRKNSPWVPVDSGFGGLAIYRSVVFLNHDYSKVHSQSRDSEHVDLHLKMKQSDQRIYINPNFINSRWNTYNVNRFFLVRQVRRVFWGNSLLYAIVKKIKMLSARD